MQKLRDLIIKFITRRNPHVVIGGILDPYLERWFVIPRNPIFNIYFHRFLRSDDDRALHDHPWSNVSILLKGHYIEHTIAQGGVHYKRVIGEGDVKVRLFGSYAHRIELFDGPVYTLFITGPRYRDWGFHCPRGWVYWKDFTAEHDEGLIGKGCDQ